MSESEASKAFKASTLLSVVGRKPDEQWGFLNPPLYKGSTVIHKTLKSLVNHEGRFFYGTAGTPTIANLEEAWTQLTGAAGTVLSSSGLGIIALAVLSIVKTGDHILVPTNVYFPTSMFCKNVLEKFSVSIEYYDPLIGGDIEGLIRANTSLLFLESPGSLTMEVQDVPSMVAVAKKYGVKTILDNTWATPLFFKAHSFGIDVAIEAGTKYVGGHSDILLGLASANSESWPALRNTYDSLGMLPGADDCHLALRGLRTLQLRVKEVERKALELAKWLKHRCEVERVLHPAFKECPGHKFWVRDYTGSTGLFSVILTNEFTEIGLENMLNNMKILKLGYSWGGYESLIIPVSPEARQRLRKWPHDGFALRIQVGLEDLDDLKRDLGLGFERLKKGNSLLLRAKI